MFFDLDSKDILWYMVQFSVCGAWRVLYLLVKYMFRNTHSNQECE